MRRLLLLAAGDPYHHHIDRLRQEGYWVVGLDRNPNAKGAALADGFVLAGVDDVEAIIKAARTHRVDAIVASTEAGVRAAAQASHYLGLPGLPVDVAHAATDKAEMRRHWQADGLKQPYFEIANSIDEARRMVDRVGLPCVAKPTRAWASKGVSVVMEENDIEPALFEALAVHGGPAIIERFVPGRLLSAEGFEADGAVELVAVGDAEVPESTRYRVSMSLQFPANFEAGVMSEATDLIRNAVRSLGLRRSPFHCECIVAPDGVYLVEMAARGAGGHVFTVLYERMTGFSGIARQVQLLLQDEVAQPPSALLHGSCYKWLSAPAGVVDRIEGIDEASRMPGVVALGVTIQPGERGGDVAHKNARHGHVCTIGADRAQAVEFAKAAADRVHFVMRRY